MAKAIADRLVDSLHTETLLLADESRTYFAGWCKAERDGLSPRERVLFACEALKSTTRLMQLIAWLTSRRAGEAEQELQEAIDSDPETLALMPSGARRLILAGIELHARAGRIAESGEQSSVTPISPARSLMERLERAF
jgi:regulator of CtrA degradation